MENQQKQSGEQLLQQMTQENTEKQEALTESVQAQENKVENGTDSSLGKFKDTQSLLDAYNNLQAEFTKKCQALSQTNKQLLALEQVQEDHDVDNKASPQEVLPIYQRDDWTQKVGEFLKKNSKAQPYAKQIAEQILQDESLAKNDSALEIAFAKIVASSAVLPEEMVEDDKFVSDYVLKSEKVKNAVLQEYLKQLKQNSTPQLMGQSASKQVLYGTKQASSLSEAKEIVKQMFS